MKYIYIIIKDKIILHKSQSTTVLIIYYCVMFTVNIIYYLSYKKCFYEYK